MTSMESPWRSFRKSEEKFNIVPYHLKTCFNDFLFQIYREEENIYKWEPKYSVYTETQTVDGETTEVNPQTLVQ